MKVFVMMPYRENFSEIRKKIRHAAVTAKVECVIADESLVEGKITDKFFSDIKQSTACIADVSTKSPNVAMEIGYAMSLGKPTMIVTNNVSDLYFNIKDQRSIIYDSENLKGSLEQPLVSWLESISTEHNFVPPEDLIGTERYENTSSVMAVKRISDSPFIFSELIKNARKQVFVAGQNLFFFVERKERGEKLKADIKEFLEGASDRYVDIMICDKNADYAIETWKYVTASRYKKDLEYATDFFEKVCLWIDNFPKIANRFTLRKVPFVPMSITFIDPNTKYGFLVLTPNGYQESNTIRPSIVISRQKNDDIFQQYWSAYYQRFNDFLE